MSLGMLPSNHLNGLHFPANFFQMALIFAAESARAAAEELDEPLGTGWLVAMASVGVWQ